MTALEQAYASNTETPLLTLELRHSALDDGVIYLVSSNYDLDATLEDAYSVTFQKCGIDISLPEKSTDGRQDLVITIDNVSNYIWQQIKAVVTANRISQEVIACKFRPFLPSDLTAPAGAVLSLSVTESSINRSTASIRATYTPIPDTAYPRYRYYSTSYPGVKYV